MEATRALQLNNTSLRAAKASALSLISLIITVVLFIIIKQTVS